MVKKISELIDLKKAYNQVLAEEKQRQDFIPDLINFADSKNSKDLIIEQVMKKVDSGQFYCANLVQMDIPKNNFCIRLGARPCLEDWIIYHALANYIGVNVEKKLVRNVYSARFDRKTGNLLNGVAQWLAFDKAFWKTFQKGFNNVLITDITAYFANINLDKLREAVLALFEELQESQQVVDLLFNCLLRPWADRQVNKGFGLPQGVNASRILGNLFLTHIDALLSRRDRVRYSRYMDDMRILAKNKTEVKRALKTLIVGLRDIGLDVNASKTEILNPQQVEQKLRDPRKQDMDTIATALNSRSKTLINFALPLLEDLFVRSFDDGDAFRDRHLRFSLRCFVKLRKLYMNREKEITSVSARLLDALEAQPGSADWFSWFFSSFPLEDSKRRLVKFLKSDGNIYDWQEMQLLDSLLRFRSFTKDDLSLFKGIAFDRNKHSLCRSKALLLVGKFGDNHDRYELRRIFHEETDSTIKRAIIIATQKLSIPERGTFYATIKRTKREHADLVEFVKALRTPLYYDDYVQPPISIIEETY